VSTVYEIDASQPASANQDLGSLAGPGNVLGASGRAAGEGARCAEPALADRVDQLVIKHEPPLPIDLDRDGLARLDPDGEAFVLGLSRAPRCEKRFYIGRAPMMLWGDRVCMISVILKPPFFRRLSNS
jgi:hypothetical protein